MVRLAQFPVVVEGRVHAREGDGVPQRVHIQFDDDLPQLLHGADAPARTP